LGFGAELCSGAVEKSQLCGFTDTSVNTGVNQRTCTGAASISCVCNILR